MLGLNRMDYAKNKTAGQLCVDRDLPAVMPIITIYARIEMRVEVSSPPPEMVTAEWHIQQQLHQLSRYFKGFLCSRAEP